MDQWALSALSFKVQSFEEEEGEKKKKKVILSIRKWLFS